MKIYSLVNLMKFLLLCPLLKLSIEASYTEPPLTKNTSPLIIRTSIYIERISSIRLRESDFRMDYFLTHNWQLPYNECDHFYLKKFAKFRENEINNYDKSYMIEGRLIDNIWTPNIYATDAKIVEKTTSLVHDELLNITVNNIRCSLDLKIRLYAIIACNMDFRKYPFDVQICPYRMSSFYHSHSSIYYTWKHQNINYDEKLIDSSHYSVAFTISQYNQTGFDNRNRSWLMISFVLQRKIEHFLYSVVFLSYLIVCVAYFSFWIGVDTGPGRFLFTSLSFFSLVTLYVGSREQLPPVSYVSAGDIWIMTTMAFVFSSILGLTMAIYFDRSRRHYLKRTIGVENSLDPNISYITQTKSRKIAIEDDISTDKRTIFSSFFRIKYNKNLPPKRAEKVDQAMRIIYPTAYAAFNLYFWIFLLKSK